jgi:hypothetical protein
MILRRFMLLSLLCCGVLRAQETAPVTAVSVPAEVESKPLPPIPELLKAVEQNEDRDEAALLQYTYHVHRVMEDFDGNEAVKKTVVIDAESFTVGGVRINRVVARDGKPLTPDEAKKENERVDKEIASAQKNKAKRDAKVAEGKRDDSIISASRMLELGNFSNERRVVMNGRSTIVLNYAGNRDAKTKNEVEKVVEDLVGVVWIDEADRVLARVEGHFLADFKVGLGLVMDIHKDLTFTSEWQKVNDEVWLTKRVTGHGKASVGVFVVRVHGRSLIEMSDYRKFRASSTIVGTNGAIGPDGKPVVEPPEPKAPEIPKP